MPKVRTTSKTYTTLEYTWTQRELLACLGIKLEPQDQVKISLSNMSSLNITITSIEEHREG